MAGHPAGRCALLVGLRREALRERCPAKRPIDRKAGSKLSGQQQRERHQIASEPEIRPVQGIVLGLPPNPALPVQHLGIIIT